MLFYRHIYFRGPCRLESAGLFNNGSDQGPGTRWINPYCERFFSGYSGFPLSSKTNISKFQFDQESGRWRTTLWMCYLQIIIVILLLFFFIYTTEPRLFASTDVMVHMNSDIHETAFFFTGIRHPSTWNQLTCSFIRGLFVGKIFGLKNIQIRVDLHKTPFTASESVTTSPRFGASHCMCKRGVLFSHSVL